MIAIHVSGKDKTRGLKYSLFGLSRPFDFKNGENRPEQEILSPHEEHLLCLLAMHLYPGFRLSSAKGLSDQQ
jgi:hypothetical protein